MNAMNDITKAIEDFSFTSGVILRDGLTPKYVVFRINGAGYSLLGIKESKVVLNESGFFNIQSAKEYAEKIEGVELNQVLMC